MRHILSIGLLSFIITACGDSSTTREGTGPVQTAPILKFVEFEDYDASFSSDGTKAAFLSNRTAGTPLAYYFDAAAETKLVRLDDKLSLDPADGRESWVSLNNSGSLVAFSRFNAAASTLQLIVAEPSGAARATLDLPAGASLSSLEFARGSDDYIAYVQRVLGVKTLKVFKVDRVAGASVTLTEIRLLEGQDKAHFLLVNNSPTLISFAALDTTSMSRAATIQSYDAALQTWASSVVPVSTSISSLDRSLAVTQAGLISIDRLNPAKLRVRLGTSSTAGTDVAAEKVLVTEKASQNDVFAAALNYDFANTNYVTTESLSLTSISGSLDGEYLLTTGLDSYSCIPAVYQLPVMKLIRRSDMQTVTLIPARATGTVPWSELATSPCVSYDKAGVKDLDAAVSTAQLIGQDQGFFLVAYTSVIRGDSEIRLAKFKVDFATDAISETSITDISANSR